MIEAIDTVKDQPTSHLEQTIDFLKEADLAQYGGSDYSNAVRVERGITLVQAFEIAKGTPEIDFFFYTKGFQMVLEVDGDYDAEKDPLGLINGQWEGKHYRVFHQGDVVFFKKEGKWLGTAPGLADVYSKR